MTTDKPLRQTTTDKPTHQCGQTIYICLARMNFGVYDDCGKVIEGLVVSRKTLLGDGAEKHLIPVVYVWRHHNYWTTYEVNASKEWFPVYRAEQPALFQWLCDCEEEYPAELPPPQKLQEYKYSFLGAHGNYFIMGAQTLLPPFGSAALVVRENGRGSKLYNEGEKEYIYIPQVSGGWERWVWSGTERKYLPAGLSVEGNEKRLLYETLAAAWGAFVGTKRASPAAAPQPIAAPPAENPIIQDIVADTVCALEETLGQYDPTLKNKRLQAEILMGLADYFEGRARSMRIHAETLLRTLGVKE